MKKFIKILLIVILVIIILLVSLPYIFKGKIEETVKTEINKSVKAKVDFKSFGLSIITSFPNLSISLKGLTVIGIDKFENDTLVQFEAFKVKADLLSAIIGESIDVKAIILDEPKIHAIVLEDSSANWDIAIETEEAEEAVEEVEEADTAASEPMEMNIKLKKFQIKDADVIFDDRSSNMYAKIDDFNFNLTGDFSMATSSLDLLITIDAIDLKMDGIRYLKNTTFKFMAVVDADLENSIYTLKENEIAINALSLALVGSVEMPDEDIKMDLNFETNKPDFKSLLSMVPAVYAKDFEGIETDGKLSLKGYVKGVMTDETLPNVGLNLKVEDARINYPDLPKSVENINIDIDVFNDGKDDANSTVDINQFHLEIANNPIDLVMHIKAYAVDPIIFGNLNMNMNLATLADAVPLEDISLSGIIQTDIEMNGTLSMIEQERYEEFNAKGNISIKNLTFNSPDVPAPVTITETDFRFSPRFLNLATLDLKIGKSDIHLDGNIENYLAYVFKEETIKGNFNFSSNMLDLNELAGSEEEGEAEEETVAEVQEVEDTTEAEAFEVPKNVDFKLLTNLKYVIYDKLEINNIEGIIVVKNGKVEMEKLGMNMLEGSLLVNGSYNSQDIEKPSIDFSMDIKDFDIPKTYETFNTVQKIAPIGKNSQGKVSISMDLTGILQPNMEPDMNSIQAEGVLQSKTIGIKNSKTFSKIGEALKSDKFNDMVLDDVKFNFTITDGRIYIDPFDTKIAKRKATISGSQGIDQTMDYIIAMEIPKSDFGGAANEVLNNLSSSAIAQGLDIAQSENINVNLNITGTVTDPKVGLSLGKGKGDTKQQIKEQVKEKVKTEVKKKVEEKKDDVKKKAKEEADKIIKEAEVKAEQIRKAGRTSADKIRKEGENDAQKVINEAKGKGKIAEKLAETSAEKIRKEANEKADKVESEANKNADKVIQEAKEKAAKLE